MTEWFHKKPGQPMSRDEGDTRVSVLGDQTPDWVRLPMELGGARVRVLKAEQIDCPYHCGVSHQRLTLDATTPTGQRIGSIEVVCMDKYLWVRLPHHEEE